MNATWKLAEIYSGKWEAYKNLDEALKWCRKTAELGETNAIRAMGDYCWDGLKGLENLHDKSVKDAERMIQNDSRYFGLGVMTDPRGNRFKETVEWYCKAAELGDVEAMLDLAEMYYDAYHYTELSYAEFSQYHDECKKWYGRAAAFHNSVGEIRYYCFTHNVPINLYYTFYGAEHGNPEKQNELGILYYKGDKGLPQDNNEAFKWFREGALQGDALSQRNLGLMYEQGRGVPQNLPEARKWFQKALDNGYATAKDDLNRIQNKMDGRMA